MVLVCLVIGAVFYISLEGINYFRLQYYRTNVVSGPVLLVADLTLAQPADYRPRWVADVGRMLDSNIRLVTSEQISLTDREKSTLDEGEVLIRLLDESSFEGEAIVAIKEEVACGILWPGGNF